MRSVNRAAAALVETLHHAGFLLKRISGHRPQGTFPFALFVAILRAGTSVLGNASRFIAAEGPLCGTIDGEVFFIPLNCRARARRGRWGLRGDTSWWMEMEPVSSESYDLSPYLAGRGNGRVSKPPIRIFRTLI